MTTSHTRMLGRRRKSAPAAQVGPRGASRAPRRKSGPATLIMRRPLIVRRAGGLLRLGRIQAIRYGAYLRLERLNFAVLAKHHVAELGVSALQESYLGLYLDQSLAIHDASLARRR